MSRHKLVRSLRAHGARVAAEAASVVQMGEVTSVSPLKVDLFESRITLEDDELVMTQWMRHYDHLYGLAVGDTVVIARKHTGGEIHWVVTDVLSDNDIASKTAVGAPAGGITVDSQARTAVNDLRQALIDQKIINP
jgi:hypothetical protein